MKKTLLLLSALATGSLFAQNTFNQANETANGTYSYYLCDSAANNLASVTGANVTWDYTGLSKIGSEVRSIVIDNTSSSAYASDFANSNKYWNLEDMTQDFWATDANGKSREGLVIEEATLGNVLVKFSTDNAQLLTYPFDFNDAISDVFSGTLNMSLAQGLAASGTRSTKYDGYGTFKVGTTTLSNVSRLHLVDTIIATTPFGNYNILLDQFEYYDLDNTNEPIFLHTSGIIVQEGSTTPMMEYHVVVSKYEPSSTLSTTAADAFDFSVAPNPVTDQLTIAGEFDAATVQIIDQAGKVVFEGTASNGTKISTGNFVNGIYVVKATVNQQTITKKIVKL